MKALLTRLRRALKEDYGFPRLVHSEDPGGSGCQLLVSSYSYRLLINAARKAEREQVCELIRRFEHPSRKYRITAEQREELIKAIEG